MNLSNINIRNANENDIDQIVNLKVNGWQNAYINIVDSNFLRDMSKDKEKNSYISKYSLNDIYVAELNEEILGFCRVYDYKKSPYDDKEIDCEIREIYIKPDIKRMGIGSKLFTYVLKHFKREGKKKLYLGVFEDNYGARRFYEKMGGELSDKSNLEINGKEYSTVSYIYYLNKQDNTLIVGKNPTGQHIDQK